MLNRPVCGCIGCVSYLAKEEEEEEVLKAQRVQDLAASTGQYVNGKQCLFLFSDLTFFTHKLTNSLKLSWLTAGFVQQTR